MKKTIAISLFLMFVISAALAFAAKPELMAAGVNPSRGHAAVAIPGHAIEVAPGVFSLGSAVDVDGRVVEGYAIVDYDKGYAKPGAECGNGICEPGEKNSCSADCGGGSGPGKATCYGFLANGAKWKSLEPYAVNPSNTRGLNASFVASNLAADIGKWEVAAGADILGAGSVTGAPLVADTVSTDGNNEVYFADVASDGAIAVTIVWGIFGGPPGGRELVEWDQVYDDFDFDWSESGEPGKMDFENIATHELGHSAGLDDLYDSACSAETMYGYAAEGETKKRTLEAGDITGVQKLYR